MLWRVQYRKTLGLIRATATEADQDAALERAFDLCHRGYQVIAVGTDATPRIFGASDIKRLFALQRGQRSPA
jgi:hypothetical protein